MDNIKPNIKRDMAVEGELFREAFLNAPLELNEDHGKNRKKTENEITLEQGNKIHQQIISSEFSTSDEKYIDAIKPKLTQQSSLFTHFCKNLNNSTWVDTTQVKDFPKCSSYLIKRACQCDKKCIDEHSKDISYDPDCKLFDLENLNSDDSYIKSCQDLALRPYKGNLKKHIFGKNVKAASKKLKKSMKDFCDTKNEAKLECAAYELRDECKNDQSCIKQHLIVPKNCTESFDSIKHIFKNLDFNDLPRNDVGLYNGNNSEFLNASQQMYRVSNKQIAYNDYSILIIAPCIGYIIFSVLLLINEIFLKGNKKSTKFLFACMMTSFMIMIFYAISLILF